MNHKLRPLLTFCLLLISTITVTGHTHDIVVADKNSLTPLSGASLFDRKGHLLGICDHNGRIPGTLRPDKPVTIRCMGYEETTLKLPAYGDTIFMQEVINQLPEVVIESHSHKLLHTLAYVREYSTLSTFTDTIFLFREKMVDFMLPPEDKPHHFKGWQIPRILNSQSYYHFTNHQGLDSVSDCCNHHFSWADWVGLPPASKIPDKLINNDNSTHIIRGQYSPTEVWVKNSDRLSIEVNVLADTMSRRWVPGILRFFRDNIDFEQLRLQFNYTDVVQKTISPSDLTGYSFSIESNGRGRGLFRFNHPDESFFVSTYAEVYILDKEYITAKEARKWGKIIPSPDQFTIHEPANAPELPPAIRHLVERVNNVDKEQARLSLSPDQRLAGRKVVRQHIGQRLLQLFKTATGISRAKMNRHLNRQWDEFRDDRKKKNASRHDSQN
ncbi:MAG: hypothetical protein K2L91_03110 [Duncaniella sp.]|nr:hypothetical protein [Duncaniella sp.]